MKRTYSKRPRARRDLVESYAYIGRENADAAERFLDAAEETIRSVVNMPGLGTPREYLNNRLSGLRSVPIRGFRNWLLFYRVVQEHVEVVRVLHGARDLAALFLDEPA
jgi:toxin ParE1/3/4